MASEITQGSSSPKSAHGFGVLCCVVFALIAVVVRGVRWDETWEHAQILAGQVSYPPGHPLALYVHNAFSLQTYLSGALLWSGAGPVWLCGLRNLLFLLASMLPVYGLVAWMSRSVLVGLLSTLLMMQGILLEFDGSYPTMVWPEIYSNGHIGGGVVLLGLVALITGHFRIAFFLVGLIPCIHLGQWPPLAAAAGLYSAYVLNEVGGVRTRLLRWGGALALGAFFSLLFWFIQRHFVLPLSETGPFASGGDTWAVWQGYTALHDPHRRFPPGNGHVMLAGTMVLATLGACHARDKWLRRACVGLGLFASVTGMLVWGTMAVHACLALDMPFALIAWMPYRLINLLPPILLALMMSLILAHWPERGGWVLNAAIFFGILQPLWPSVTGQAFYARYLAGGECVVFVLFGLALIAVTPSRDAGRWRAVLHTGIPILALGLYHHFGAVCVVVGILLGVALNHGTWPRWSPWKPIALWSMLLAGSITLLVHQYEYRRELPVSAFQQAVAERLKGQSNALLLAPPDNLLLQATTRLPVLAEVATPSLISYLPGIGPAIDQMYEAIYGMTFKYRAPGDPNPNLAWDVLWRARSESEWRDLASTFGFTHVLAPVGLPLQLPQILAVDGDALYAVNP